MFIDWPFDRTEKDPGLVLAAPGFPGPAHAAEPDLFCRQRAMPGHDQARLDQAHIGVVGCGGLGGWVALGLARLGVPELTLIDPDTFDRTNAPRQLMFPDDLGQSKAHRLAQNTREHMTNPGLVRGLACDFIEAGQILPESVMALFVGVDNNRARLDAARFGLARHVPVVFGMLSSDGLRGQVFLQTPHGPCLWCVLPNLDPDSSAPCAAASVASCWLVAAHAVALVIGGVMGIGTVPTWRETALDGSGERASTPGSRPGCLLCQPEAAEARATSTAPRGSGGCVQQRS